MASLVLLQGGEAVPHPLGPDELLLGRHPECTIQLQSNMVSRKHARVVRQDEAYCVEDLGSGNGTFLNGQKLEPHQPHGLKHNDRIKLGPILLRYESASSAGAAKPNPKPQAPVGPLDGTEEFDSEETFISKDEDVPAIQSSVSTGGSSFGLLNVNPEKKLKGVIDITRSLAGTVDPKEILPKIVRTLFEVFPHADRGSILLRMPGTETIKMYPAFQMHRREGEDATVRLSRTILSKVLTDKAGILSADAASDSQFQASESIANLSIRSMMCVPMLSLDGEVLGIINIDTMNPLQQFNEEDLDLLLAVAGQAAVAFENARLLESYMEKIKQDSELGIATKVQQALLPETLPEVEGWDFFASYDAAQAVGGDYYDAFMLTDDKICLSFGDVAGKGVPGALIMSRISSCVQNTMPFLHDVSQAIEAINNHMCRNMVEGRFVTYVLVVIDLKTNLMKLVNAGHMSPMIRRVDGEVDSFDDDTIGIPVGIIEDYEYEVVERVIEPGEMVVIITDGVDEAMNRRDELYTKERVIEFISNHDANARQMGIDLLADVRKHADGRAQNDDITIMTFGRLGTS